MQKTTLPYMTGHELEQAMKKGLLRELYQRRLITSTQFDTLAQEQRGR